MPDDREIVKLIAAIPQFYFLCQSTYIMLYEMYSALSVIEDTRNSSYKYIYIYIYIYIYTHTHTHIYIYICICIYVYIYVHKLIQSCIHVACN